MKRSKRARSLAARKGWVTRRARLEHRQREHGRIAREKSEARLTPQQKAARTRAANRLEAEIRAARRSAAAHRGWATRRANQHAPTKRAATNRRRAGKPADHGGPMVGSDGAGGHVGGPVGQIYSLDQLDDYPDWDDGIEYDVETSPDYGD